MPPPRIRLHRPRDVSKPPSLYTTNRTGEQVKSSFRVTLSGAGVGILGSLPLFASGLALETRRDWAWVRMAQATTERVVLKLFGSKRQVSIACPPLRASAEVGGRMLAVRAGAQRILGAQGICLGFIYSQDELPHRRSRLLQTVEMAIPSSAKLGSF